MTIIDTSQSKLTLSVSGQVSLKLYDQYGNLKDARDIRNKVPLIGTTYIANRMVSNSTDIVHYMSIGTNNTMPNEDDYKLLNQVSSRVACAYYANSSNQVTYVATFPAGNPATQQDIVEAGLFNNPGLEPVGATLTNAMLARTTFEPVTKLTTDSLTISWVITISAI